MYSSSQINYFYKLVTFVLLTTVLQISALPANRADNVIQVPLQGNFPDSSTRCGDVLQGWRGTISYKSFSPTSPNERCVWTIRNQKATIYSISLDNLGRSSSVIITGIRSDLTMEIFAPTAASSTSVIFVNGTVVVTSFHRTTTTELGFCLRCEVNLTGDSIGNTSREVVARSDIGHIKHPLDEESYSNHDLSVFLFAPINGLVDFEKKTEIIYIREGLQGLHCDDRLQVFIFDINRVGIHWKLIGEICEGVDSEIISNKDLIMLVFQSDSSNVNMGFHLYSRSIG